MPGFPWIKPLQLYRELPVVMNTAEHWLFWAQARIQVHLEDREIQKQKLNKRTGNQHKNVWILKQ
jgi:hypothetical protein